MVGIERVHGMTRLHIWENYFLYIDIIFNLKDILCLKGSDGNLRNLDWKRLSYTNMNMVGIERVHGMTRLHIWQNYFLYIDIIVN